MEGDWLEGVKFDKQSFWEFDRIKTYTLSYANNPLPSDCRFRIDLIAL